MQLYGAARRDEERRGEGCTPPYERRGEGCTPPYESAPAIVRNEDDMIVPTTRLESVASDMACTAAATRGHQWGHHCVYAEAEGRRCVCGSGGADKGTAVAAREGGRWRRERAGEAGGPWPGWRWRRPLTV
jgi:hypothetical protein